MTFDPEDIPGVGPVTAEKLLDGSYDSAESIAVASNGEIASVADVSIEQAETIRENVRSELDIGGFSTGSSVQTQRKTVDRVTTGISPLDELLDKGIESGTITEIFGSSAGSRSLLAHQFCVRAQLPVDAGGLGGGAIYLSTENTFDPNTISAIVEGLDGGELASLAGQYGLDADASGEMLSEAVLENIRVVYPEDTDTQLLEAAEINEQIGQQSDVAVPIRFVCVDTLTGHFRSEFDGQTDQGERAQKLHKHLNELTRVATDHNYTVVVTNHPGNSSSESFLGKVTAHATTVRLKLLQRSETKHTARLVSGSTIRSGEVKLEIRGGQFEAE